MSLASPKRLSRPACGAIEPPCKRPKTDHAPDPTAQHSGDRRTKPAVRFSPGGDQNPRPLTTNFNDVCEPQAPGNFQSVLSRRLDHRRLPQGFDYSSSFGNPIARSRASATREDDYISPHPHEALTASFNTSPSPIPSQQGAPMIFNFGPEAILSFSEECVAPSNQGVAPWPEVPSCGAGVPKCPWDGFDNVDFTHDAFSSCNSFEALDPLSIDNYTHNMHQPNPPSPFSRSMSRSSFGSSSLVDPYSPYPEDYPTPASDTTAVTTPAPSEGYLGSPSEHPQVLFGQDFSLAVEAQKTEHEPTYVSGSAPLSPSSFSFDFSLPQTITFPSAPNVIPLSTARRHSEPANLTACHFPSFFAPCHEASPQVMPAPGDSMTHSIMDNLASSSSASASPSVVPSSIAPHQTQLPLPVEIQHPRPVRAFKPQILLSGHHYDPKDFIRRRSEPIIPLPELDVASHVPFGVVPEDEEDDPMEVEDSAEFEGDRCGDEQNVDHFGHDGSWTGSGSEHPLLDPEWSWLQSVAAETQLAAPATSNYAADCSFQPTVERGVNLGSISWNTY